MKQNDDEDVNRLVTNIYGSYAQFEESEDFDKSFWGQMRKEEDYEREEYEDAAGGIENDAANLKNFDLSHLEMAGEQTGFTSGFEYAAYLFFGLTFRTPGFENIRKDTEQRSERNFDANDEDLDRPLYRVLTEKRVDGKGGLLSDNKGYDMPRM